MSERILIVDDEAAIRQSLEEALRLDGYEAEAAETGEQALAMLHNGSYDLVVTDLKMPGVSGLELLTALRNQGRETPVIMMTAYGDVETAVESMRLGAYDFIQKPFKLSAMRGQVRAALRATRAAAPAEEADAPVAAPTPRRKAARTEPGAGAAPYMDMIRACPGLAPIADLLEKVGASRAGNDTSVLIRGESGSGKEVVARAIHEASGDPATPFMEINCAAVPETLLESELMGHEKGAFTDAKARKEGLFEMAGGGTIFLDEIGEMGVLLQSRLLRVIENRRFRRVGGKDELTVNARIVAATNRELESAINEGLFRNDLYYRLQVVEVNIPPLRERPDDVGVLLNAFIQEFNQKLGLRTAPASAELVETLRRYPWPGNVREMRNVLKRIMILEEPAVLTAAHFPRHIAEGRDPRTGSDTAAGFQLEPLADTERRQILETLNKTDNNKSKAARILGISRQTLREKLKLYGQAAED
ncbi:MAG TPA: sigma-54 dependent transcriptional regulator [Candidatus Krumholzibacteria bacterium]|nr:sigma-54 dependent transcriptional regulator [Candidatus Krumholzibacteria bacterium]HRX50905.1 sigma-54 dependent transcriptional regulator [Candidatus Krumholzibacteria bacterium]